MAESVGRRKLGRENTYMFLDRRLVLRLGILAVALLCGASSANMPVKSNQARLSTCQGTDAVSFWRCANAQSRLSVTTDLLRDPSVRRVLIVSAGNRVKIKATGQLGQVMRDKATFLSMGRHYLLIVPVYL